VEQVAGPAAKAGIRRGDIILSVNGAAVDSLDDLKKAAESGKTLAVLLQRADGRLFVPVQPG
jgi:serine protease Do